MSPASPNGWPGHSDFPKVEVPGLFVNRPALGRPDHRFSMNDRVRGDEESSGECRLPPGQGATMLRLRL